MSSESDEDIICLSPDEDDDEKKEPSKVQDEEPMEVEKKKICLNADCRSTDVKEVATAFAKSFFNVKSQKKRYICASCIIPVEKKKEVNT